MGAVASGFDFPLKSSLTDLCNGNASFDMRWLNHAGMVRNNAGNALPGTRVVTFLENHDTGKEHDKWVTKDWHLGYAYMLTHEGRPCLFYPHLYGVTLVDNHDSNIQVSIPASLKTDLKKLIFARSTYLNGIISVLSQTGNPYPSSNAADVYVARRQGNGVKDGAIVVINNSYSTKGMWVSATPSGWSNWSNKTLVNAFDNTKTSQVYGDGRVWVEAPARGYAIYVLASDYVAWSELKSTNNLEAMEEVLFEGAGATIFPNPIIAGSSFAIAGSFEGKVAIKVYDMLGNCLLDFNQEVIPGQDITISGDKLKGFTGTLVVKISDKKQSETKLLTVI
jgi:alpha-amylase